MRPGPLTHLPTVGNSKGKPVLQMSEIEASRKREPTSPGRSSPRLTLLEETRQAFSDLYAAAPLASSTPGEQHHTENHAARRSSADIESSQSAATAAASTSSATAAATVPATPKVSPSSKREKVEAAIPKVLPKEQRQAFEEASRVPNLIQNESDPALYLEAFDGDVTKAAEKMCLYWKIRRDTFGPDRAFRPLSLTGQGALAAAEVKSLKGWATTMLPLDQGGRPILLCQKVGSQETSQHAENRRKHVFYLIHDAINRGKYDEDFGEDDKDLEEGSVPDTPIVQNGLVSLFVLDHAGRSSSSDGQLDNQNPILAVLELFQMEIFPIRVRAVHGIAFKSRALLNSELPSWTHSLKAEAKYNFLGLRSVPHFFLTKEAAQSGLKQYGILESSLPHGQVFGGKYDLNSNGTRWYCDRVKRDLHKHPIPETTPASDVDADAAQIDAGKRRQEMLDDLAAVTQSARAEEAKARKRRVDAIYQKKKRDAERFKMDELKQQVEKASSVREKLSKEQQRLQSALQKGCDIVFAVAGVRIAIPPPVNQSHGTQGLDSAVARPKKAKKSKRPSKKKVGSPVESPLSSPSPPPPPPPPPLPQAETLAAAAAANTSLATSDPGTLLALSGAAQQPTVLGGLSSPLLGNPLASSLHPATLATSAHPLLSNVNSSTLLSGAMGRTLGMNAGYLDLQARSLNPTAVELRSASLNDPASALAEARRVFATSAHTPTELTRDQPHLPLSSLGRLGAFSGHTAPADLAQQASLAAEASAYRRQLEQQLLMQPGGNLSSSLPGAGGSLTSPTLAASGLMLDDHSSSHARNPTAEELGESSLQDTKHKKKKRRKK